MKLYNTATGKIENKRVIKVSDGTLYVNKLTDKQFNSYGYYRVKYTSAPNRRYYDVSKIGSVVGSEYVVGYDKTEKQLEPILEKMIQKVEENAKFKMEKATSKYSNAEMAGWETLEAEAREFIETGKIKKNKLLKDEADACGQDYLELANEIKANADDLRQLRTYAVSTRYNKKKEIQSLKTIDDCILYEKTPYEYIVTQEDVDNDIEGVLTLGQAITRYKNNVTDW